MSELTLLGRGWTANWRCCTLRCGDSERPSTGGPLFVGISLALPITPKSAKIVDILSRWPDLVDIVRELSTFRQTFVDIS